MFVQEKQGKITFKTFILEHQKTQYSQVVPFPVDQALEIFDLECLFQNKIPDYHMMKFRIYDFSVNEYVEIEQVTLEEFKIPVDFFKSCNNVILIKYRKLESQTGSFRQTLSQSDRDNKLSQTSSTKKQRSKERIIAEVIEIVKRWRELHFDRTKGRKVSLQEAAKIIGLPKKSLDDYYYQLRLGQKYGFDFKMMFYEKIGILRNFLKQKKPRLKSQKSDKHPKNLKVIQNYDQIKNCTENMRMDDEMEQQMNENKKKNLFEEPQHIQEKLEDQFYQDFGFLESSQQDPFVTLDSNFKKKKSDRLFDQQIYF